MTWRIPERLRIEGITSERRNSTSIGLSRPEASSSLLQSSTASAWEPIAARAASSGRHLSKQINEWSNCLNVLTNPACHFHELVVMNGRLAGQLTGRIL